MTMSTEVSKGSWFRLILPWLKRNWAPILLILIAVAYAGEIVMMHTKALSPIDEWVYSDYLDKIPTEGIIKQGEVVGLEARNRIACDGVFPYGGMGAPCGGSYLNVANFPFGGVNSADAYAPTYFVVTWLGGAVIKLITGASQITAWRLTSVAWLAATIVVLVALFRAHKVPDLVTAALTLAFIVSPFSWWTYTFVSTDAPSVFFGALLMLLATRRARGQGGTAWLVVLSAVAVTLKVTNLLGVGLAALYLLVSWLAPQLGRSEGASWTERLAALGKTSRLALAAVAVAAGGLLTQVAWMAVHQAIALGPPASQGNTVPLTPKALASQLVNFLPNTLTSNVLVAGGNGNTALPVFDWAVAPLSWICVAGVLSAFWARSSKSKPTALVVSTAVASFFFAPALAVALTMATHSYFGLPSRYGASILPAILLVTAITIRSRWAAWLILAYGGVLGIGIFYLTASYNFM